MNIKRKRKKQDYITVLLFPFVFFVMCFGAFAYAVGLVADAVEHNKSWRKQEHMKKRKPHPSDVGKPSDKMTKLMAEGYRDNAEEDLALAKEFEGCEPKIEDESSVDRNEPNKP